MDQNIINVNCKDELKESYTAYAKAVAIDRALPDIRDGLKPVQRRILYSMYKNGNIKDKPYRKSARIVGDVMGKYHPHGDCLDASTEIFLANGEIKTIEEIYKSGEDVDIIAYDIENKNFCVKRAHHFRIGQHTNKIYKISFKNDDETFCGNIKVTPNHPILLENEDFRKSEDINFGDYLFSVSMHRRDYLNQGLKKDIFKEESTYVCKIERFQVDKVPMYDFTVDDLENMMIPVAMNNDGIYFLCVHNSSIYEAMAKMSENYSMNIPLIDGQGNFGSVDGDKPAAMRYTEARLERTSMEFLKNLEKESVDFVPNFDNSLKEPEVLPVMLPNLLVNGSSGIGVGIATNIPSFNLKELLDASIKLVKNENVRDATLFKTVTGPDFPLGGVVDGKNLDKIYETGRGSFDIYGVIKKEKSRLVITEIPQTLSGNKEGLIEDIIKKVDSGKIPEITGIEDQSGRDIRIVLNLRRGSSADSVIAKLYKNTLLKSNFSVNLTGVYKDKIKEFNLREYLEIYVEFIKEIKRNALAYDLKKLETRSVEVEGLIYALENIKLIVEIITGADKVSNVRDCLSKGDVTGIKFETKGFKEKAKKIRLKDLQIDIILRTRLSALVGMEKTKLLEESKKLKEDIQNIKEELSDNEIFNKNLIETLREYKKLYGKDRKTVVKDVDENEFKEEEEITTYYALIDDLGYLKKVDSMSFARISDDTLKSFSTILEIDSDDRLAVFTRDGSLFYIEMDGLPKSTMSDRGEPLENFLENLNHKDVLYITKEKSLYSEELLFVTKNGFGKFVDCEDYKPTGTAKYKKVKGSNIEKDDYILNIFKKEDVGDIEVETENRILRFKADEIPYQGKAARGVYLFNKKYLPLKAVRISDFKEDTLSKRARAGRELSRLVMVKNNL